MRIAFLFILTVMPKLAFCQQEETFKVLRKYPRGDNYVKVSTSDPADVAFKQMFHAMEDYQWKFNEVNEGQLYAETVADQYDENHSFVYVMRVRSVPQGSQVFLRARCYSKWVKPRSAKKIEVASFAANWHSTFVGLSKMMKEPSTICFARLYELASAYPNAEVATGGELVIDMDREVPADAGQMLITTGLTKQENGIKLMSLCEKWFHTCEQTNDSTVVLAVPMEEVNPQDPGRDIPEAKYRLTIRDKAIILTGEIFYEPVIFEFVNSSITTDRGAAIMNRNAGHAGLSKHHKEKAFYQMVLIADLLSPTTSVFLSQPRK